MGLTLWSSLERADRRAPDWNRALEALNRARNAIAHDEQDKLEQLRLEGFPITLVVIRRWRRDLDRLAETMDDIVSAYLDRLLGHGRPW